MFKVSIFLIASLAIGAISADSPFEELKKQYSEHTEICLKETGMEVIELVPFPLTRMFNEKPRDRKVRAEKIACLGKCIGIKFGVLDNDGVLIAEKAKEMISRVVGTEIDDPKIIDEAIEDCKERADSVDIPSKCLDASVGMMCLFRKYYPLIQADMERTNSIGRSTPRSV